MSTEAIRAAYQRVLHHTLAVNCDNRDQVTATADTFRAEGARRRAGGR